MTTDEVRDGSGAVVAREGETVRLSGGEVPAVEDHTSVEIPERCAGLYWLAGSEIERAESE